MPDVLNRQGVRDLNESAAVYVERWTGIVHLPHKILKEDMTACNLDLMNDGLFQPLDAQAVTCLSCIGAT